MRNTKQREAVKAFLEGKKAFFSAQQIFTQMVAEGTEISLPTVYRNLQRLADLDEVDVISVEGESLYRICATDHHHHHLVCRLCGKTVDIAGPEFERWVHNVADQAGFSEVTHSVDIFGICKKCHEDDAD
ncbi:MAG: Fur family transcriptional regulator [Actinomycetaceae bacterium]|nr:Fur family transcriptional regulator [Actinomycetaceae bacterium]